MARYPEKNMSDKQNDVAKLFENAFETLVEDFKAKVKEGPHSRMSLKYIDEAHNLVQRAIKYDGVVE